MSSNNNKRSGLGKGLSALLQNSGTDIMSNPNDESPKLVGGISDIFLSQIEVNPFQPRDFFEEQALNELAESIKIHGVIQPITVRKLGYDKFQLISGERRFRASKLAGLEKIPAYIRVANDQGMLEMALIENIHRENLDAIEVAISYKRLLDECKITQEELSERVSKQRSTVTNYLRLLKLPAPIQLGIRNSQISMGHARTLITIDDEEKQLAIFAKIIEEKLSVRDAEELAKLEKTNVQKESVEKKAKVEKKTNFENLQNDFNKILNTKVDFKLNNKGKGKIIINIDSLEQLEKIKNILQA
jgi:ParB family transcriptional regulator, chromosome partitioning protein